MAAAVAQLVEHRTRYSKVAGSVPAHGKLSFRPLLNAKHFLANLWHFERFYLRIYLSIYLSSLLRLGALMIASLTWCRPKLAWEGKKI